MKDIYITSAKAISPQETLNAKANPERIELYNTIMKLKVPDYKMYFEPLQSRRMSNLVKACAVCSKECVIEAGISNPDSVIIATSLGNIEESEKFLKKVIAEGDSIPGPTNFINANHNSTGSQIAIHYECHGYNMVYSHKTASFESALLDASMLIDEGNAVNILIGAMEEITAENYELKKSIELYRAEPFSNQDIIHSKSQGSIPGEGVAFFMLSSKITPDTYCILKHVSNASYLGSIEDVEKYITKQLKLTGLDESDIDLVLTGCNGDSESDKFTNDLIESLFPDSIKAIYKHLCGEYDTASSFGLWFAAMVLKAGQLPDYSRMNQIKRDIRTILMYNHDGFRNHSLIIIQAL